MCIRDRLSTLQSSIVHALQNVEDGLCNVDDVGAAGLQIGVIHGGEYGGLIVAGGLDGVLSALVLAVDDLLDGVHEVVVIQHHGVDVEHLGDVLAGLDQSLLVQSGLLVDGLGAGVLKTGHFSGGVGHFGGRDDGIFFLIDIEKANELFSLDLPENDDYQTIGGLILHQYLSLIHI